MLMFALADDECPIAHGVHPIAAVRCCVCPATHSLHSGKPTKSAKVPAAHGLMAVRSSVTVCPTGDFEQL